jgi:histidyl-tRNA synthetase
VLDLQQEGLMPEAQPPAAYAVVPDAAALPRAVCCVEALRAAGLSVVLHAAGKDGRGSMKSQFKKADASGARFALIFGPDDGAARCRSNLCATRCGADQPRPGAEASRAAELSHA